MTNPIASDEKNFGVTSASLVCARADSTQSQGCWQPIETAPKDGTPIQAKIPGHGSDNVIAWFSGLINSAGEDCGGWQWMGENEPPESWTDGVCWAVNEDGIPSVQPTEWKHLPSVSGRHSQSEDAIAAECEACQSDGEAGTPSPHPTDEKHTGGEEIVGYIKNTDGPLPMPTRKWLRNKIDADPDLETGAALPSPSGDIADLVESLGDEADLCRNDGATDIANLLHEAAQALKDQQAKSAALTREKIEWSARALIAEARAEAAESALTALQAREADYVRVLRMVHKNNQVRAGKGGKAWDGGFVEKEVAAVLELSTLSHPSKDSQPEKEKGNA